ncbi:hypothetical protein NMY22_g4026 [Coprinellus aureogranulatus]|nr:hypothetical protein NMY22_g4026 [Coprinellus aureogranulatus]
MLAPVADRPLPITLLWQSLKEDEGWLRAEPANTRTFVVLEPSSPPTVEALECGAERDVRFELLQCRTLRQRCRSFGVSFGSCRSSLLPTLSLSADVDPASGALRDNAEVLPPERVLSITEIVDWNPEGFTMQQFQWSLGRAVDALPPGLSTL